MTAGEWLGRAWRLDAEIAALIEAREQAMARCMAPSSGLGERVSGGDRRKGGAMDAYIRLGERLNRRIDELCDFKSAAVEAISRVEDSRLRALLIHRYVNLKTWEQIAEALDVEVRHVYRLHKRALDELNITCR